MVKFATVAKVLLVFKRLRYKRLGGGGGGGDVPRTRSPPAGSLPVYVGDERERFVVPTGFLSHPLFRMLLEKAYREYGFEQRSGLSFPCSVSVFREVVSAVKCRHGRFDLGNLVEEFV